MHGLEYKSKLFEKKSSYCSKANGYVLKQLLGKSYFKWNASYWSNFEF